MPIAHIAVYDTLADWEAGHLLAELRSGRFTGTAFDVVTVSANHARVLTMGGLRIQPDTTIDAVDPSASDLLVLPGADGWEAGEHAAFAALAANFLAAGVPVAAICGAVFGLASSGLLDERRHTGAAAEYLAASGYAGSERYAEVRAVADRGLITAGPDAPVQFARATLAELGLLPDDVLEAYERVFADGDPAAHARLMAATA